MCRLHNVNVLFWSLHQLVFVFVIVFVDCVAPVIASDLQDPPTGHHPHSALVGYVCVIRNTSIAIRVIRGHIMFVFGYTRTCYLGRQYATRGNRKTISIRLP